MGGCWSSICGRQEPDPVQSFLKQFINAPKDRLGVLEAVRQNGRNLQFVGQDFRADREVVLEAVKSTGWAFKYAGRALRGDRELALEAVKRNGLVLGYASEELRADREIVLAAAGNMDGEGFEYASSGLRSDRDFVLEVVKRCGLALAHAAEELKNDRDIVVAAVKNRDEALREANIALYIDPDLLLLAARSKEEGRLEGPDWSEAFKDMRQFEEIVETAIAVRGEDAPILTVSMWPKEALTTPPVQGVNIGNDNSSNDDKRSANKSDEDDQRRKDSEAQQLRADSASQSFCCEVSLLSGASFTCCLPDPSSAEVGTGPANAGSGSTSSSSRRNEAGSLTDVVGNGPVCGSSRRDGNGGSTNMVGRGPEGATPRGCPTVADLARQLVELLPQHTEAPSTRRIFLNFLLLGPNPEKEAEPTSVPVSPWDWQRPVTDFLLSSSSEVATAQAAGPPPLVDDMHTLSRPP